jgi:hypothetical protein
MRAGVPGPCFGATAHPPAAGLWVSVKQVEDIAPGRANAP